MKTIRCTCHRLLLAYDLLHFFELHGPFILRGQVVDYLRRSNPHSTKATRYSLDRAFDRLKQVLRLLGIHYDTVQENAGASETSQVWFCIEQAAAAKRYVSRLLDELNEVEAARRVA